MPKLSKDAWIMLSLLGILLLIAFIGGSQQDKKNASGFDPRRTSYSTAPAGLKGLYETLDKLGYRTRRHIDKLTVQPEDGVLFVITPDTPPSDEEMHSLQSWVERGNTLIMVSDADYGSGSSNEHLKAHKTAPVAPSFLTPDVRSFNVTGSGRIRDADLGFGESLTCSSGYG